MNVSLERLKKDCVDLFYLHAPDHATPIEETLAAVNHLYRGIVLLWDLYNKRLWVFWKKKRKRQEKSSFCWFDGDHSSCFVCENNMFWMWNLENLTFIMDESLLFHLFSTEGKFKSFGLSNYASWQVVSITYWLDLYFFLCMSLSVQKIIWWIYFFREQGSYLQDSGCGFICNISIL